ncbi:hypothetical protein GCWU000341_00552 [Oribacterium sp. oral taxon 078 str. F0262]|nr:hypothetical protein GCWU000341_00552 [Oribacterium sp. oral taxon 078 str. F0262]
MKQVRFRPETEGKRTGSVSVFSGEEEMSEIPWRKLRHFSFFSID